MTRLAIFLCALGLGLVAAVPASAHYTVNRCGSIAFTPQTDEGASAIRAHNMTCRAARRLVRAYHDGDRSPSGFTCRSRSHDPPDGLAHSDVICTRGVRRVTWAAY
jgi:hypothetical protein